MIMTRQQRQPVSHYSLVCFFLVYLSRVAIPFAISDEYGRPFIILKEQQAKARVKGIEATKVSYVVKALFFVFFIRYFLTFSLNYK